MLDAKVRYSPTGSANSLTFDSKMLLEEVQNASVAMLRTATAAMSFRRPEVGACWADLAGACVAYSGPDVPLTCAIGLGTSSAVDTQHIAAMENWWRPLTDIPGKPVPDDIQVQPAAKDDAELWVRTVAAGFQESDAPVDDSKLPSTLLDTFYCFGFADGAQPFLVRRRGEVAGGGVLHINGQTAHLRTTSCRFVHRRNGVQTALLNVRLNRALEAGCRFVFSSTAGIGASARNLERFGLVPLSISFLMSKSC